MLRTTLELEPQLVLAAQPLGLLLAAKAEHAAAAGFYQYVALVQQGDAALKGKLATRPNTRASPWSCLRSCRVSGRGEPACARMQSSAVSDGLRFGRNMEQLYRMAVRQGTR